MVIFHSFLYAYQRVPAEPIEWGPPSAKSGRFQLCQATSANTCWSFEIDISPSKRRKLSSSQLNTFMRKATKKHAKRLLHFHFLSLLDKPDNKLGPPSHEVSHCWRNNNHVLETTQTTQKTWHHHSSLLLNGNKWTRHPNKKPAAFHDKSLFP